MLQEYLGLIDGTIERSPLSAARALAPGAEKGSGDAPQVADERDAGVEPQEALDVAKEVQQEASEIVKEGTGPPAQEDEVPSEDDLSWSDAVGFTLTLDYDIQSLADEASFKQAIIDDVSKAAGVAPRFLYVAGMRAGSLLVDMLLSSAAGNSAGIMADLVTQLESPASMLMLGQVTCKATGLMLAQDKEEREAMSHEEPSEAENSGRERASQGAASEAAARIEEGDVSQEQEGGDVEAGVASEDAPSEQSPEHADGKGTRVEEGNGEGATRGRKAVELGAEEQEEEEVMDKLELARLPRSSTCCIQPLQGLDFRLICLTLAPFLTAGGSLRCKR